MLLVLALIAFWPLVLHPTETLYSNTSDLLAEHLPAKYFLVRSLRETGELPLWNPEQYAGSPFVHDIQVGLFYPPNLPFYFISEPAIGPVASWLVFLHVLLAGWFMFAYARHAGLGELAAFTAGVGYMLSPRWMLQIFVAGHTVTQGICWLPLVLLCIERAMLRREWTWAVVGGAAYAMLILGTHPQWTFYGSLLIGFWPLRLLAERNPASVASASLGPASLGQASLPFRSASLPLQSASLPRKRGEEAATTPPAYAGGSPIIAGGSPIMAGGSPIVAGGSPIVAGGSQSGTGGSPSSCRLLLARWLLVEATVVAIGVALCAVQLLPTMEAAGESSRARGMGQSWSLDGAKAAAMTLIGPIPDKVAEPIHWETRGGIGFTWAVMAVLGARLGGRKTIVPTAIALGMLAYALGGSYFIDRLPGFNNFRMPTRMLLTLAFPVAFLAGHGVQSVTHERARSELRLASAFWAIVLINMATIALVLQTHGTYRIGWFAYILLLGCAWTLVVAKNHWRPGQLAVTVAALMIAELLFIDVSYPDTRPADEIYPRSPIIDYIREHNPDGHRTYDLELQGSYHVSLLGPGSPAASVHGVPSIRGYNPLDVARYRQFLAYIANIDERQTAFSGGFTHPVVLDFPFVNRRLIDLLGVRYLIAAKGYLSNDETTNLVRLDTTDMTPQAFDFLVGIQLLAPQFLHENKNVMPRAFVVPSAVPEAAEADVLTQLKAIDFHHTATLHGWDAARSPLPGSPNVAGPAHIRSHTPNEIRIDLDGRAAGLLVLTDPWYPGWVCRVDGQEVPIWKADYAFRGVMVPEGSREVVFHFEPQSYRRGKWISSIALAGVAVFFLTALVRRRRHPLR